MSKLKIMKGKRADRASNLFCARLDEKKPSGFVS